MKTLKALKIAFIVAFGFGSFATAQTTTVLHAFSGQDFRSLPYGGLISSGGVFYGTTSGGGTENSGTVFKINPDGTGKSTLHNFAAYSSSKPTNTDGAKPYASLIISGSTLYGTTSAGGSSGNGTVFKVNTDGSGFAVLYTFTGGADGATPVSSLVLSGSTLYGTASQGGSGYGTVFKVNTNGTGFAVLYAFTDGSDGSYPMGGLVLSGSTLYGTSDGDSGTPGNVFKINTNGALTTLYSFTGLNDGGDPNGLIVGSDGSFYGTTQDGSEGGAPTGTVFMLTIAPDPELTIVPSEANVVLSWPTNYGAFSYAGYTLQTTTNLDSSAVWTPVSSSPVIIGGQNKVVNPLSGTQRFFRLSQ